MAIASLPSGGGDDDGLALHTVGRQDRDLWLGDDRHGDERAVGPGFVIVNVPPDDVVGGEPARARPCREVGDRHGRCRGATGHRRGGRPGTIRPSRSRSTAYAEIDVPVEDERIVADRGVEVRVVAQHVDDAPGR